MRPPNNGGYIGQSASSIHPTEGKIRRFSELGDGWHYGEGVAFDASVLRRSVALHWQVMREGYFTTDAFPGLYGQVVVTIYDGDHYVEYSVEPDGTIEYVYECEGREIQSEVGLTTDAAIGKLRDLRKEPWKSSESSSSSTMTYISADFSPALFSPQAGGLEEASPSSANSALQSPEPPSASTSAGTTPTYQRNPRYSGAFPRTHFPLTAG